MGFPKRDISNERFGKLIAIKEDGKNRFGQTLWLCKCDCGNSISTTYSYLIRSHTRSCGCLKVEATVSANTKHGHGRPGKASSEYGTWQSMKSRCCNPNNHAYKDYGGRGIKVCDRWLNSFENFLADMGAKPTLKHSLDRYPDNNGNYEPSNCRWATQEEQCGNQRTNKWIEFNGERKIVADWARTFSTTPSMILKRIKKGHPLCGIRESPTKEVLNLQTGIFYDSIKEAADSINMNYSKFYFYLNSGRLLNKFICV